MTILLQRLRSRRIQREQSETLRTIRDVVLGCVAFASVGAFIGVMLVETIVGCGEVEYNMHNGTWQTLPCVFVPYTTVSGTY